MKTLPKKDRRAKTGSNLRGKPLLAHRSKLLAEQQRPLERLARDFQREAKKLFSKADLRTTTELANAVKSEWRQASITVGGDCAKLDAIKASARRKLDRLLAKAVPNYRKLRTLQREHGREHRKLVKGLLGAPTNGKVSVSWDNVLPADGDADEFTAPFPIFNVHTIDEGGHQFGRRVVRTRQSRPLREQYHLQPRLRRNAIHIGLLVVVIQAYDCFESSLVRHPFHDAAVRPIADRRRNPESPQQGHLFGAGQIWVIRNGLSYTSGTIRRDPAAEQRHSSRSNAAVRRFGV
jgi:hypothetical protein